MISINKGEENTVVLTLQDRLTLVTSAYVFKFVHDQSGEEIIFTAQDQSLFTERYNLFNIDIRAHNRLVWLYRVAGNG